MPTSSSCSSKRVSLGVSLGLEDLFRGDVEFWVFGCGRFWGDGEGDGVGREGFLTRFDLPSIERRLVGMMAIPATRSGAGLFVDGKVVDRLLVESCKWRT